MKMITALIVKINARSWILSLAAAIVWLNQAALWGQPLLHPPILPRY